MITTLIIVLLLVVAVGIAAKYLPIGEDAKNILWLVVITILVLILLGQL